MDSSPSNFPRIRHHRSNEKQISKTEDYIISPKEKPPLGQLGGSVHDYERGKDPFARECMPAEFQDRFPNVPARTGWLALDYWGNVIGFAADGDVIRCANSP